jgi:hypothetical protein
MIAADLSACNAQRFLVPMLGGKRLELVGGRPDRRFDPARRDRVDSDAVGKVLSRCDPGEMRDGGLARPVSAGHRRRLDADDRAGQHDALARSLLLHDPQRRAQAQECSVEVNGHDAAPFGEFEIGKRSAIGDAGVDVGMVEPVQVSLDPFPKAGIAHVTGDAPQLASKLERFQPGLVQIHRDDLRDSVSVQPLRHRLANARSRAGDERRASCEIEPLHVSGSPPRCARSSWF